MTARTPLPPDPLEHGCGPRGVRSLVGALQVGTEPLSRGYLSAKGIRDIASGLFAAIFIAHGSAHALGWFMLVAAIIPIADAAIVLHHGGSKGLIAVAQKWRAERTNTARLSQ
jgi:hypothetical protein